MSSANQNNPFSNIWLYQARRVNTQTAAGPAALVTRISMNTGQIGKILECYVIGPASATSTLVASIWDENGAQGPYIASIAAGVWRELSLPTTGTTTPTSGSMINTTELKLPPGGFLRFAASVSILNENLTVYVLLELTNISTVPIWDTTGSGGTPSLAASTISATNTLVRLPVKR